MVQVEIYQHHESPSVYKRYMLLTLKTYLLHTTPNRGPYTKLTQTLQVSYTGSS